MILLLVILLNNELGRKSTKIPERAWQAYAHGLYCTGAGEKGSNTKCLVQMTNHCIQERVVVENDHWLVVVPYW